MASILVIADDLTGAAELGGVALRYHLSVEVSHHFTHGEEDVRIINTNTRSLDLDAALHKIRSLFTGINVSHFEWIYLKFDSALRGHIYHEISLYSTLFNVNTLCFCPVNLSLDRVIRKGKYYVGDHLISQTSFAKDPEFPILADDILPILGTQAWTIHLPENVPNNGFYIGEVDGQERLQALVEATKHQSCFAGAAAYFEAILASRYDMQSTTVTSVSLNYPVLFVCGSTHANSRIWLDQVSSLHKVFWNPNHVEVVKNVTNILEEEEKAVIAVDDALLASPEKLRQDMAEVVSLVCKRYEINELCVEGGATAFEIFRKLEIDSFAPLQELGQGVIRSKVKNKNLYVTIKPGSYPWSTSFCIFSSVLN